MELVSMADYQSRFQPNLQHIAPRGTYPRLASLAIWNGTRLSEEQALADAIGRITANFEKPRLAVVAGDEVEAERDPMKWRRLHHDYLNDQRRHRCSRCKGTGEIAVHGEFGEYEQPEPCPRCQRANPHEISNVDEKAF